MIAEKMVISPGATKFSVGQKCLVRSNDGKKSTVAELISVKTDKREEYYVHYINFDRRLDEWIGVERISECDSRTAAAAQECTMAAGDRNRVTRNQRRMYEEINHVPKSLDDMDPTQAALEKEHEQRTKVKYTEKVQIAEYLIDTWYVSNFPEEFERAPVLYVCEMCLKYTDSELKYRTHLGTCDVTIPPGVEIYRDIRQTTSACHGISVFEVDGRYEKLYCQCLCLVGKLFLDHKTLYYDVEPFLFYILCEVNDSGAHLVGYFSKEKNSPDGNNLACIMILPPYQRKGYGKFLIQLSYELSKRENHIGGPEKPLSDLGKLSYRSYWAWVILQCLSEQRSLKVFQLQVDDLSGQTGIAPDDIMETLKAMNLAKHWKGVDVVCALSKSIDDCMREGHFRPPSLLLQPRLLRWQPPSVNHSTTDRSEVEVE